MSDLSIAYDALVAKNAAYTLRWQYADGDHPLTYTNQRLREVFQTLDARFIENWCGLVLAATLERIQLQGFDCEDEEAEALLLALWTEQDLAQDADEVHEAALVCGESFLVCWPDASDQLQAYYNDPRLCHVVYDSENPRQARFAAKRWNNAEDGHQHMTLYYPDHLEYYVSSGKAENVSSANSFQPAILPNAVNPYGEIPVFHFRTRRRAMISDLADVIPVQNGLNKLLADMMVAAEYGAFMQRWIISSAEVIGKLRNAPNEIWSLPAGDGAGQQTQVGQFTATDLKNYLDAIDRLAMAIAIITRTPKHYFLAQGGDPSGEALIALEAPLNKKAQSRINRFAPTWRRAAAFMLKVLGHSLKTNTLTPRWAKPETVQPRTTAEIRQMAVTAGLPLVTTLKREGWTEAELAQMAQDREDERDQQQTTLAQAMMRAQRQFDQGQQAGETAGPEAGPNA